VTRRAGEGRFMSFFTRLPKERYSPDAFVGFTGGAEFNLNDARALIWMS